MERSAFDDPAVACHEKNPSPDRKCGHSKSRVARHDCCMDVGRTRPDLYASRTTSRNEKRLFAIVIENDGKDGIRLRLGSRLRQ